MDVSQAKRVDLELGLAGVILLAGAGVSAELARAHLAQLCGGGGAAHCIWCYAAAALASAGLAALVVAMRPALVAARRRPR